MDTDRESQAQNVRDLVVVAVVAAVFSSFTLWLMDSWIKYPLFLFEILAIIDLYLILAHETAAYTVKERNAKSETATPKDTARYPLVPKSAQTYPVMLQSEKTYPLMVRNEKNNGET